MNKKPFIFLSALLCCVLVFTMYPLLNVSVQSKHDILEKYEKRNAFVTVLCDPSTVQPTLVSIYSLQAAFSKKPSSRRNIHVVIPDSIHIQDDIILILEKLGVNIVETSFAQTSCVSYRKDLPNLSALLDYGKIVYFTNDIVFDNDVDQLFNQLPNSAILSTATEPSLLLLEPNFSRLEPINDKHNLAKFQYQLNNVTDFLLQNEIVQVYTGPMKPWNFHSYGDTDWKKEFDPVSFYQWRKLCNGLNHFLNPKIKWKNELRQNNICDDYIGSVGKNTNHFPIQDQFSVMISTYNPERIEHLSLIIRHLLKSKVVHTIYVTWHNPALDVPSSLYDSIQQEDYHRLKIAKQSYDSLNNRFNPIDSLQTNAVYIMDDDIVVDLLDLEFAFNVWKSHKDSIVGHFPRVHTYDSAMQQAAYKLSATAPYTIILTKSMFIRSEYLFAYTCVLEPKLHEYVDEQLNCEDLGFAMMVSGLSQAAPTLVNTKSPIEDFGLKKGISTNSKHMPARAECISNFITRYWQEKDPLIKSYDTATPFVKPKTRMGKWVRVEQIVSND